MGVVLSLQGCMAVGKTTAARAVCERMPEVLLSPEENAGAIAEVKRRALKKDRFEDYVEIQKLWIENEIQRWRRAQAAPVVLMDFGAEEIEFYTLHYPLTIGRQWPVEEALADELAALRRCLPRRILFLDADDEALRERKAGDDARDRQFFEHYLTSLLPLKRQWFAAKKNVDRLDTTALTRQQTAEAVCRWVRRQALL